MGQVQDTFDKLKQAVADADADVMAADKGGGAPGTRLRKVMQTIKEHAAGVRVAVLLAQKAKGKTGGGDEEKDTDPEATGETSLKDEDVEAGT